jgi:hypothetical protein
VHQLAQGVRGYYDSPSCTGEELGLNIGCGAHLRSSPIGHGYAFADHATVAGTAKRCVQGVDGIPAPPGAVEREERRWLVIHESQGHSMHDRPECSVYDQSDTPELNPNPRCVVAFCEPRKYRFKTPTPPLWRPSNYCQEEVYGSTRAGSSPMWNSSR